MTIGLGIGIAFAFLVLVGALLFLVRSQHRHLQGNLGSLQQSLQGIQQNLTVSQKEFERSQEEKVHALRSELSNQLKENRMELQYAVRQTSETLDKKVGSIDQKLDIRLGDLNKGVQEKLEANLKEGFRHFEKVQEHLKFAGQQLQHVSNVGQSINDLNALLKMPHLRGNFGEAVLEQLLTDLLPSHAFELQYGVVPHSSERVDAIVKYPKSVLPIDSKFPREQVLPLFETNDPAALETARKNLADVMKNQARQIKEKYVHPEHGTTDMALLFVPSETLYFEILRNLKLCDELTRLRVFAVSPNTLAVTLHSISIARDYYEMAEGVEKTIAEVKKARKHFENFERRFHEVGKGIKRAQDAFDTATTHLGRYNSAVNRLAGPSEADEEAIDTLPAGNA